MPRRVAVIFPEAETEDIERFRLRHDPLGGLVAAHITIAYPFDDDRDPESLSRDVEHAISDVPAFRLSVGNPLPVEDENVFLLVTEGARWVRLLHERMYAGPLAQLEKPLNFVPHMTIGRASNRRALEAAVAEAAASGLGLSGLAHALSVYRIDEHGRRGVEFQVPLRVDA